MIETFGAASCIKSTRESDALEQGDSSPPGISLPFFGDGRVAAGCGLAAYYLLPKDDLAYLADLAYLTEGGRTWCERLRVYKGHKGGERAKS